MNSTNPIKIAVVGPESTGKSTLTGQLAKHYSCNFVPEYAREYIANLNRPYRLEDIVAIAKEQWRQEREAFEASSKLLICDTNLLVTKIWAQNAFQLCPDFINTNWKAQDYDLHLLMNIDLPWQDDPQREHPHLRKFFFDWYEKELKQAGANYVIIQGLENQRYKGAVLAIDTFLSQLS